MRDKRRSVPVELDRTRGKSRPAIAWEHFRWLGDAACRDADPEIFFEHRKQHIAKAICAGCSVRSECLAYAETKERNPKPGFYGVFGGKTAAERRSAFHRKVKERSIQKRAERQNVVSAS